MARKSNNGDGLLIDTWHWRYQGVVDDVAANLRGEDEDPVDGAGEQVKLVKDQVYDIQLRLLKHFNDEPLPRSEKSVEFVVRCDALNISLRGTDVEALRQALFSKLEHHHHIKWKKWYLVQIANAQSFKGDFEVGFALSQNTIYRGVARDGTVLMREYDRGRTFGPWRYKPWPAEYEDRGGHVIACIPGTPENDRALDEFRDRIRALQERLSDLVKPELILKTLANLSGVGLPAPLAPNQLGNEDG